MKTEWPSKGPDFNNWQTELDKFMAILKDAEADGFWCVDWDLKYLTIRIDTRDNGWLLFVDGKNAGDPKERIDPQRVVDAIEQWRAKFRK